MAGAASCDDEGDAESAAAPFCGPGASGSASATDSTGCKTCVCACASAAKGSSRTAAIAATSLGEMSGLTLLVYRIGFLACVEQRQKGRFVSRHGLGVHAAGCGRLDRCGQCDEV